MPSVAGAHGSAAIVGGAHRLAGTIVEGCVVLGPFDLMTHHKTVAEMDLLVGAQPVGAEEIPLGAAMDRTVPAAVVEADQILGVDVVGGAGVDPGHGRTHSAGWPRAAACKSSR